MLVFFYYLRTKLCTLKLWLSCKREVYNNKDNAPPESKHLTIQVVGVVRALLPLLKNRRGLHFLDEKKVVNVWTYQNFLFGVANDEFLQGCATTQTITISSTIRRLDNKCHEDSFYFFILGNKWLVETLYSELRKWDNQVTYSLNKWPLVAMNF